MNVYLDRVLELTGGVLPRRWSEGWSLDAIEKRYTMVKEFAWAIPDDRALDLLARHSPIVEMGAGSGYWAAMLEYRGADVVAYDREPGANLWVQRLWTDVKVGGPKKVVEHADRTLFLCWPPYESPFGYITLARYLKAGGRRVIYVGEHEGGCCASDEFFKLLGTLRHVDEVSIPQWPGIHDYLSVWEVVTDERTA